MAFSCLPKRPTRIKKKLADAVQQAVTDPDVVSRLSGLGIAASTMAPTEFGGFVEGQMTRWSTLIKDRNIALE